MECPNCHHPLVPQSEKRKGGKPPYGFLATGGELTFNDSDIGGDGATGIYLARIMRWNQFEGVRVIAQTLNAQNIPSPSGGTWSHGSVARVIRQGKKYSHLIPIEYVLGD